MFAQSDARSRIQPLIVEPVLRILLEQLLEFAARLGIFVKLDEHLGIFLARCAIFGRQPEDRRQQDFRIVVHLSCDADAREQAHGLHLIAVLQKIGSHHRFGRVQIAVLEQSGCGHDLSRNCAKGRHMARRHRRILGLARHAVETFEHRPAAGHRVIQVHRAKECLDRRRRLLQFDEAAPALLVKTAEARMMPLQGFERAQRIGDPAQIALGDGHEQQRIAVVGCAGEQRPARRQRLGELALSEQRARPRRFGSKRGWRRFGVGMIHEGAKKRADKRPPSILRQAAAAGLLELIAHQQRHHTRAKRQFGLDELVR